MSAVWPNGLAKRPLVTSPYGRRTHPISGSLTFHYGIDSVGYSIIKSPMAGVVTFARYFGGHGNQVRVRHDDGSETRHSHNRSFLVREGQRVPQGGDLAVMGTTGASTGVHSHFETRPTLGGSTIDPNTYIAQRQKEDDMTITTYPFQNTKGWDLARGKAFDFPNDAGVAHNLVGAPGDYAITVHLYGEGLHDGEHLDLVLVWQEAATGKESLHYVERIHGIGAMALTKGEFKRNVTFHRAVATGYRVFARLIPSHTARVTMVGADAVLYA